MPSIAKRTSTCGCILAGGEGRRLQGQDKGQLLFRGRPLVAHVADRLRPQVDEVIITANRNLAQYTEFATQVFSDHGDGFQGPLAGISAAFDHCQHDWIATVPCDSPFFPSDLVDRLGQAAREQEVKLALARCAGRTQPVFSLIHQSMAAGLRDFLAAGERKIMLWADSLDHVIVDFTDPLAFSNINTEADLQAALAVAE